MVEVEYSCNISNRYTEFLVSGEENDEIPLNKIQRKKKSKARRPKKPKQKKDSNDLNVPVNNENVDTTNKPGTTVDQDAKPEIIKTTEIKQNEFINDKNTVAAEVNGNEVKGIQIESNKTVVRSDNNKINYKENASPADQNIAEMKWSDICWAEEKRAMEAEREQTKQKEIEQNIAEPVKIGHARGPAGHGRVADDRTAQGRNQPNRNIRRNRNKWNQIEKVRTTNDCNVQERPIQTVTDSSGDNKILHRQTSKELIQPVQVAPNRNESDQMAHRQTSNNRNAQGRFKQRRFDHVARGRYDRGRYQDQGRTEENRIKHEQNLQCENVHDQNNQEQNVQDQSEQRQGVQRDRRYKHNRTIRRGNAQDQSVQNQGNQDQMSPKQNEQIQVVEDQTRPETDQQNRFQQRRFPKKRLNRGQSVQNQPDKTEDDLNRIPRGESETNQNGQSSVSHQINTERNDDEQHQTGKGQSEYGRNTRRRNMPRANQYRDKPNGVAPDSTTQGEGERNQIKQYYRRNSDNRIPKDQIDQNEQKQKVQNRNTSHKMPKYQADRSQVGSKPDQNKNIMIRTEADPDEYHRTNQNSTTHNRDELDQNIPGQIDQGCPNRTDRNTTTRDRNERGRLEPVQAKQTSEDRYSTTASYNKKPNNRYHNRYDANEGQQSTNNYHRQRYNNKTVFYNNQQNGQPNEEADQQNYQKDRKTPNVFKNRNRQFGTNIKNNFVDRNRNSAEKIIPNVSVPTNGDPGDQGAHPATGITSSNDSGFGETIGEPVPKPTEQVNSTNNVRYNGVVTDPSVRPVNRYKGSNGAHYRNNASNYRGYSRRAPFNAQNSNNN